MPGLGDVLDVAFKAGHLIGQGVAAGDITGEAAPLLEAVGRVLATCDELSRQGEDVLARVLREKALAALHANDGQTIEGTAVEPSPDDRQISRGPVDHFTNTEEDAAAFHRMHGEGYR